ncbi:UHRF1-binding protein 1-like protein, partial [Dinothrombium tinctorium]
IFGILLIVLGAKSFDFPTSVKDVVTTTPDTAAIVLVVIGVVLFAIAFLGCCGAFKENHCMLVTFSIIILIILIVELIIGGVIIAFKNEVRAAVKTALTKLMDQYHPQEHNDTVSTVIDELQQRQHCCGVESYKDWYNVTSWKHNMSVPSSCCKNSTESQNSDCAPQNAYTEGCLDVIESIIKEAFGPLGGVAITIAIVQLLGVIFACCLAYAVKKEFFKNLSSDKLNLHTMKGQCDFFNLELNETVLMDILEFPLWLNLSKATCNHVIIKIPWTKLKTLPIQFYLDEVVVVVETCEEFRKHRNDSQTNLTGGAKKYGYAERLIDGIRITINSVVINFKSYEFYATFQLSYLTVESRPPNFEKCNDLRLTRIKDESRGQILTFKHIEWQALKLEAKSEASNHSTPLRFITGVGSCRITIKKQLSDCQVLGARIVLVFDDLRWILTDAMLLSAFHLVIYLNNLIKKSPITPKKSVEDTTPTKSPTASAPSFKTNSQHSSETPLGRYFSAHDVVETSYHLFVKTLELYLCDDLKPQIGRSCYPPLESGGCLHVILMRLVIDTYPYHKSLGSRKHWFRSIERISNELDFITQHIQVFAERNSKMREFGYNLSSENSKLSLKKPAIDQILKGLLSLVMIVRIADYRVEVVSTNSSNKGNRKQDEKSKRELLKTCSLPDDMPSVYLEINNFYYYEIGSNRVSTVKKAPQPTTYLQIAPFQFLFDPLTLLWANAFHNNLRNAIEELKTLLPETSDDVIMHSRIELLMPTFIFDLQEGSNSSSNSTSFHSMEAKCTRIVFTNNVKESSNLHSLNNLMESMTNNNLFMNRNQYPWINEVDSKPVSEGFMSLIKSLDNETSLGLYYSNFWFVNCDPFWLEFRCQKTLKVEPFVDPIQITAWLYISPNDEQDQKQSTQESDAAVSIILNVHSPIRIFIDHEMFLFLMRLIEQFAKFDDYLEADSSRIKREETRTNARVSISTVLPTAEIHLILSREWNRTKSIGTSLSSSPMMSGNREESNEVSDVSEEIASKSISKPLNFNAQNKALISKSESDSVLISSSSVSFSKDGQKTPPSIVYHKPLTAVPPNTLVKTTSELISKSESSSALGSEPTDLSPYDDDNRSIRSDLSGDSDLCLINGLENMMTDENDYLFVMRKEEVEEALDLSQDSQNSNLDISSPDSPISISLLSIRTSNIALVKQSNGSHSSLLLQCNDIDVNENLKRSYDEFKNLIMNPKNIFTKNEGDFQSTDDNAQVTLRTDALSKPGLKSDIFTLLANKIKLELNVDTVQELSQFIEDPDLVEVKPMVLLLTDISAKLNDFKVKTPPMELKLQQLALKRESDNSLNVLSNFSKGDCSFNSGNNFFNSNFCFLFLPDAKHFLISPHIEHLNTYFKTKFSSETKTNQCELSEKKMLEEIQSKNEELRNEIKRLKEENEYLR